MKNKEFESPIEGNGGSQENSKNEGEETKGMDRMEIWKSLRGLNYEEKTDYLLKIRERQGLLEEETNKSIDAILADMVRNYSDKDWLEKAANIAETVEGVDDAVILALVRKCIEKGDLDKVSSLFNRIKNSAEKEQFVAEMSAPETIQSHQDSKSFIDTLVLLEKEVHPGADIEGFGTRMRIAAMRENAARLAAEKCYQFLPEEGIHEVMIESKDWINGLKNKGMDKKIIAKLKEEEKTSGDKKEDESNNVDFKDLQSTAKQLGRAISWKIHDDTSEDIERRQRRNQCYDSDCTSCGTHWRAQNIADSVGPLYMASHNFSDAESVFAVAGRTDQAKSAGLKAAQLSEKEGNLREAEYYYDKYEKSGDKLRVLRLAFESKDTSEAGDHLREWGKEELETWGKQDMQDHDFKHAIRIFQILGDTGSIERAKTIVKKLKEVEDLKKDEKS